MTDEQRQQVEQEKEAELKRPEKEVKDLEPDQDDSKDVKGGASVDYMKYGA